MRNRAQSVPPIRRVIAEAVRQSRAPGERSHLSAANYPDAAPVPMVSNSTSADADGFSLWQMIWDLDSWDNPRALWAA